MPKNYSNRTDLANPAAKIAVSAAKGQAYGEAGKQRAAQQAVPIGSPPAPASPPPPTPIPGQVSDLTGPTQRPNEPMSAGMNFGPGPSSAVFGDALFSQAGSNKALAEQIRAIAAMYPNPALLQLAMDLEE